MAGATAWHIHHNVKCTHCGALVWPQTTCVSRVRRNKCRIPRIALCKLCQAVRRATWEHAQRD